MEPCHVVDIIKYFGDMEWSTVDIMNIFIFSETFATAMIYSMSL